MHPVLMYVLRQYVTAIFLVQYSNPFANSTKSADRESLTSAISVDRCAEINKIQT